MAFVRLDPAVDTRVELLADELCITRSVWMRAAVSAALASPESLRPFLLSEAKESA